MIGGVVEDCCSPLQGRVGLEVRIRRRQAAHIGPCDLASSDGLIERLQLPCLQPRQLPLLEPYLCCGPKLAQATVVAGPFLGASLVKGRGLSRLVVVKKA